MGALSHADLVGLSWCAGHTQAACGLRRLGLREQHEPFQWRHVHTCQWQSRACSGRAYSGRDALCEHVSPASPSFAATRFASQLGAVVQSRLAAAGRVRPRRTLDRLSTDGNAPPSELEWSSHRLAARRASVAGVPGRGQRERAAAPHPPAEGAGMVDVVRGPALLHHRAHTMDAGRPAHLPPPRALPYLH
jgi:hypothetical protein